MRHCSFTPHAAWVATGNRFAATDREGLLNGESCVVASNAMNIGGVNAHGIIGQSGTSVVTNGTGGSNGNRFSAY